MAGTCSQVVTVVLTCFDRELGPSINIRLSTSDLAPWIQLYVGLGLIYLHKSSNAGGPCPSTSDPSDRCHPKRSPGLQEAGFTALHMAARHGHVAVLRFLLEAGAKLDCRDQMGANVLHTAAEHGQVGCHRVFRI